MYTRCFVFFLFLLNFITLNVWAEIYTYTDEEGVKWITDSLQTYYKYSGDNSSRTKFTEKLPSINCAPADSKISKERKSHIDPIIRTYSKQYGVNPTLIRAIVSIESCYDSNAISRAGAQGLMQLMPRTAKDLGVTNSFDIKQNLQAGIRYFGSLNKRFKYNSRYALAAYNAGPNTVDKYAGIPPFTETKVYVSRVINKYKELASKL